MKNISNKLKIFFCSTLLFVSTVAVARSVPLFKDGERVCFIGDSITHGGSYHSYIYLYYLTRFPNREIHIFNTGISGDTALKTLERFDEDIALNNPTVCTLMLGMNDVGRNDYGKTKTDETSKSRQECSLNQYFKNMNLLIHKIDALCSGLILITPSIYDQNAEIESENCFGVNDALGKCARFVKTTAEKRGDEYIDFYEFMNLITTTVQRNDCAETIVGPDRIHPRPDPGHFIMAYQFLQAQDVPKFVSEMVLDAQEIKVTQTENCSISEFNLSDAGLSFVAYESALPFPQTESIAKGLSLVPFTKEMNQEILSVKNLQGGEYILLIDEKAVGTYSADQLSGGINLAVNTNTPQYQQSLEVKKLNEERFKSEVQLRNAAFTYYKGLDGFTGDPQSIPEVTVYLNKRLESFEGMPWYTYIKQRYDEYLRLLPHIPALQEKLSTLHDELYSVNQPKPHHFQIYCSAPER